MDNPGLYSLGDFNITVAGTQTGNWLTDLEGMVAALVSLRFQYGSGGTSVTAYLQSTADGGTTAYDIASVVFETASEHRILNFSALTPKGQTAQVPTDGALTADIEIDGMLGNKMRLKVVTVGTYAGSTVLSGRVNVR